jgi:outer membrane protein assembly factor BamB
MSCRTLVSQRSWTVLGLVLLSVTATSRGGLAEPSRTGDWPGFWGPNRDARVAGPLRVDPGMQLKEIWRRPIGKGMSEIAVVGSRGYTMFSDGHVDYLLAFDVATGKEIWRAGMKETYRGHGGSQDGPLSTPVVSDGRIFALDPFGRIFAFNAETGRELWRRDLPADLGAVAPLWGFSTTPLPVGKTLVIQAGGTERNNLVGLDVETGKTVWSSQPSQQNGYSSPVLMTLAGVLQVVAATTDKLFGVDPKDGSILWSHPALGEPRQSPIDLPGDRIFVTCWQESAVLQITREGGAWKVQEVWRKPVFKATYSPTLYHDGHLYGMNGNFLSCLDARTGELKWREKIYNASLILVDGHLAILSERSGNFHLVEATPAGFHETLKAPVFTPGAQSMTGPMFTDGRFLLRNMEEMVLLELKAGPPPASAPAASPAAQGKEGV